MYTDKDSSLISVAKVSLSFNIYLTSLTMSLREPEDKHRVGAVPIHIT